MRQGCAILDQRPMVPLVLLFILGILLAEHVAAITVWISVSVIMLSFVFFCGHGDSVRTVSLCLLVVCSGCLRQLLHEHPSPAHLKHIGPDVVHSVTLQGIVEQTDLTLRGTPKLRLRVLRLDDLSVSGGLIIAYIKDLDELPAVGDTLTGNFEPIPSRMRRNPSDFDYGRYLHSQGVYLEMFPARDTELVIHESRALTLRAMLIDIRSWVRNVFEKHTEEATTDLLLALILGQRRDVDAEIKDDFSRTGVIHVLAVSGLHVGYVALILIVVADLLRFNALLKLIFILLGLCAYVLLTGGAASVLRAATMGSLLVIGKYAERRTDIINILGTAAFLMLCIDPSQIHNIGFQLSFSAVLSIVIYYPRLETIFGRIEPRLPQPFIPILKPVSDLFFVSLAAQLGTLPLTLYYFGSLPLISLVSNLVVVPLIGLIVAIALCMLIVGWIHPCLCDAWGTLLDALILLLIKFVHMTASISWASVRIRPLSLFEVICLTLFISAVVMLGKVSRLRVLTPMTLIWINVWLWKDVVKPPTLELVMLDVGQGDALVLHTPDKQTLVFDAGPRFSGQDAGRDVISPYLLSRGWSRIDALILSHPHNDHIGGAQFLVEHHDIGRVIMPAVEYESYGFTSLMQAIREHNIPLEYPVTGDLDTSMVPLYLRYVAPKQSSMGLSKNLNNFSLVLQIFYGQASLIITGDAEQEVESYEEAFGKLLHAQIIKVPHHGSRTSSSTGYLRKVSPEVALMSLGMDNKFEHPAPETLLKYADLGVDVFRTDHDGALIFSYDGKSWGQVIWR